VPRGIAGTDPDARADCGDMESPAGAISQTVTLRCSYDEVVRASKGDGPGGAACVAVALSRPPQDDGIWIESTGTCSSAHMPFRTAARYA
jgi:hypothetical protein